jgi:hypothetical protein
MLRITIRTIPIIQETMCGTKSAGLPFAAPTTSKIEMIRPMMSKTRAEMIMLLATRKLRQSNFYKEKKGFLPSAEIFPPNNEASRSIAPRRDIIRPIDDRVHDI